MSSPLVSLLIVTLNEEDHLADCIRSVGSFADEIVVCDTLSTDRTCEIAASLGARVCQHEPSFAIDTVRPFAVSQTQGKWVFVLDADERATPELLQELREYVENDSTDVVAIRWDFLLMGKFLKHSSQSQVYLPRFFKKDSYVWASQFRREDETFAVTFPGLYAIERRIQARNPLLHLAYPNFTLYAYKTFYHHAWLDARDRYQKGERLGLRTALIKPLRKFIGSYILRLGFMDGVPGLIMALGWSMYHLIVAFELYDLQNGNEKTVIEPLTWQQLRGLRTSGEGNRHD